MLLLVLVGWLLLGASAVNGSEVSPCIAQCKCWFSASISVKASASARVILGASAIASASGLAIGRC